MILITLLLIILIGFTGTIVSLLRDIRKSNHRIIELLDENEKKKKWPFSIWRKAFFISITIQVLPLSSARKYRQQTARNQLEPFKDRAFSKGFLMFQKYNFAFHFCWQAVYFLVRSSITTIFHQFLGFFSAFLHYFNRASSFAFVLGP